MNDDLKGDAAETGEWLDALDSVEAFEGLNRVDELLDAVVTSARRKGAQLPFAANTAYVNTIRPEDQPPHPGDRKLEQIIRRYIRWNAAAIVLRANKESSELGGHIASFQSAATLYDTGFMHFWRAADDSHGGDLVYFQGHSSPGIYARAFLEGRLSEDQLIHFRQEVGGHGLSSYPHPWLMPEFWQFPTVSMGLGPLMGIYQARFLRYLHGRGVADTDRAQGLGVLRRRRDGRAGVARRDLARRPREARQPDFRHQLQPAAARRAGARQRQDRPGARVRLPRRGLERHQMPVGLRLGPNCSQDHSGKLRQLMEECVDGEYQDFKSKNGAYIRKNFFGRYPETAAMVADWSDDKIWSLTRGGHDPIKVYAAYRAASRPQGPADRHPRQDRQGLRHGRGRRRADDRPSGQEDRRRALKAFRDRFDIPLSDADLAKVPFLRLPEDSEEMKYLRARRAELGGPLPSRRRSSAPLEIRRSPPSMRC